MAMAMAMVLAMKMATTMAIANGLFEDLNFSRFMHKWRFFPFFVLSFFFFLFKVCWRITTLRIAMVHVAMPRIATARPPRDVQVGTKPAHFETSNHSLSHVLRSEWVSERTNEGSGAREQSELCGASEWVSSAGKGVKGRASGLVHTSQFLAHLNHCYVEGRKVVSPWQPNKDLLSRCRSKQEPQVCIRYEMRNFNTFISKVESWQFIFCNFFLVSVCLWKFFFYDKGYHSVTLWYTVAVVKVYLPSPIAWQIQDPALLYHVRYYKKF